MQDPLVRFGGTSEGWNGGTGVSGLCTENPTVLLMLFAQRIVARCFDERVLFSELHDRRHAVSGDKSKLPGAAVCALLSCVPTMRYGPTASAAAHRSRSNLLPHDCPVRQLVCRFTTTTLFGRFCFLCMYQRWGNWYGRAPTLELKGGVGDSFLLQFTSFFSGILHVSVKGRCNKCCL